MGEWLKPAVLKTVSGVTRSGVRIPLPPPLLKDIRVRKPLTDGPDAYSQAAGSTGSYAKNGEHPGSQDSLRV